MVNRRTLHSLLQDPNKHNPILPSYFFQTLTFALSSPVFQWFLLFRFSKQTLYYLTCHIMYYVNNIQWRVRHEAVYVIFCTPVPTSPSHQIFSSPLCPHKPSVCVLFLTQDTKFHTHTKWHQHCQFHSSELNGSKYCLNICCFLFPRSRSFSTFVRI